MADRLKLFHALLTVHPDADSVGEIATALTLRGGQTAAEPLWSSRKATSRRRRLTRS